MRELGGGKEKNPLEPIAGVAAGLFNIMVMSMGVGVLFAIFGGDAVSFFGAGGPRVCADANATYSGSQFPGMPPGVTVSSTGSQVCAASTDWFQHLLAVLVNVPEFVIFMGVLWAVRKLTRAAERDGVYSLALVSWVRRLGWWLTAGSVAAMVVRGVATTHLLASMLPGDSAEDQRPLGLINWDFPTVAFVAGLGVLTLARILRIGVGMREDLEGTV
jgi:hypothetical protein